MAGEGQGPVKLGVSPVVVMRSSVESPTRTTVGPPCWDWDWDWDLRRREMCTSLEVVWERALNLAMVRRLAKDWVVSLVGGSVRGVVWGLVVVVSLVSCASAMLKVVVAVFLWNLELQNEEMV